MKILNSQCRGWAVFLFVVMLSPIALADDQSDREEAISEFAEGLCYSWNGEVEWRLADGRVLRDDLKLVMKREGQGFQGEFFLGNNGKREKILLGLDLTSGATVGELSGWVGSTNNRLGLWMPNDALDRLQEDYLIFLDSGAQYFDMRFENKRFDLYLSGQLPFVPDDAGSQVVGTVAHLRRDSFRLTLGAFEITLMECLGVFATLFFASRFVVQWVASERAQKSVVPEMFWWISLCGALMMMTYGIYFERVAVVLGQLTGWVVYIRNIWLIEKEKRKTRKLKKSAAKNL